MNPGNIKDSNRVMGAPKGVSEEHCSALSVIMEHRHEEPVGIVMHSAWIPEEIERKAIAEGNPILLTVFGTQHPMVSLGVIAGAPQDHFPVCSCGSKMQSMQDSKWRCEPCHSRRNELLEEIDKLQHELDKQRRAQGQGA